MASEPLAIPMPVEGVTLYSLRLTPTTLGVGPLVTLSLTQDPGTPGLYTTTNVGGQTGLFAFAVLYDGTTIVADGFVVLTGTTAANLIGAGGSSASAGASTSAVVAGVTAVADRVQAAQDGAISITEGDVFIQDFLGLGNLAGRSNLFWAMKTRATDSDDAAIVLVDENTGLRVLNRQDATATPTLASLTVLDVAEGDVRLTLLSSLTDQLKSHREKSLVDAIKATVASGLDWSPRKNGIAYVRTGIVETTA